MHSSTRMHCSAVSASPKTTTTQPLSAASSSTTMPTLASFTSLFQRTSAPFRTIVKEFDPTKLVEGGHFGEHAGLVQASRVIEMRCISVNCTAHSVCHSERRRIEDLASDLFFVPSVAEIGTFTENTSMLTFPPAPTSAEWMTRPRTRAPTRPSPPAFTTRLTIPQASTRTACRDVANTTVITSDIGHAQRSVHFADKAKATDSTAPRSHKLTPRRRSQRASLQQHDVRLAATLGSAGLGQRGARRPHPSHNGRSLWLSRAMPSPVRRSRS